MKNNSYSYSNFQSTAAKCIASFHCEFRFWIFNFNGGFSMFWYSQCISFIEILLSHCGYQVDDKKLLHFFRDSSHLPKEVVVPFSRISGELQVVVIVQMFSPRIFFRLKSLRFISSSNTICTLNTENAQCSHISFSVFVWMVKCQI